MSFGLLLLVAGLLWLLGDLGLLPGGLTDLWRLWPLILVALGLDVLFRDRPDGRRASLLITLVLLALSIAWISLGGERNRLRTENVSLDLPTGVELVSLELTPRLAEFELSAGEAGGELLAGKVELLPGERLRTSRRQRGDHLTVSLSTRSRRLHWNGPGPHWRLHLNPRPLYRLRLELGVGNSRIDLRGLRIERFDLQVGVGKTTVFLPDSPGEYEISGGVGDLTVYLPESVAVSLEASRGIGSLEVSGLERGTDAWKRGLGKPLQLKIRTGIGRVRVLPAP